jgi:hypothetical protein
MIEITASMTGSISTGAYDNEKPLFSLKETLSEQLTEREISVRQENLYLICRELFEKVSKLSQVERISQQKEGMRFYSFGLDLYPSVTSIIDWDSDFHTDPLELNQHAARGNIIHKQIEIYLREGIWKDPKDIPECYPDLVILKKGSLGLRWDDVDFRAFYSKYPFEVLSLESTVVNHELKYAGRSDCKAKFQGKISILDWKSGSIDETKFFKQLTAYWHAEGNEDVEQVVIVPLTNKTKQGFSEPKILADKEKYWTLFKRDRENFKRRFLI